MKAAYTYTIDNNSAATVTSNKSSTNVFGHGSGRNLIVNPTFSYSVDVSHLTNGYHKIVISAYLYGSSGSFSFSASSSPVLFSVQHAPHATIFPPRNQSYAVANASSSIPLNFTVDNSTSWIGYSSDGKANVTIIGNTTVTALSKGTHSLKIYANDTFGNIGASETGAFTVAAPEPFPVVLVAVVSVAVAFVAKGLLVYFRKSKR